MMSQPVVLDLETQHSFREVSSRDPGKLKISIVGIYDYATDQYLTFTEPQLNQLFQLLERASAIIGFNIINFDLPVLAPYYLGDIHNFWVIDLLKHIEAQLGFRVGLNNLAKETLNLEKHGHGLQAIEYFRDKQMDKLRSYCLSDVKLTRSLYEYGKLHKQVYYQGRSGKQVVAVNWDIKPSSQPTNLPLTIPW